MSLAKYHAKSLLKKFAIKTVPVDPYIIASEMGVTVTEDDCEGVYRDAFGG